MLEQFSIQSNLTTQNLVPILLDIDVEGQRNIDTFTWNPTGKISFFILTDNRVIGLIKRMGSEVNPKQKRRLCMNKVDLVENKKDLLMVADQFKDLPGYERYFMIYGLKDSGVKDLTQYLTEHALKRPWDEDPLIMTDDVLNISLEVVREKLLDHIHQGTLKGLRITVVISSGREGDGKGPAWAPLFNNYMLTTSKLQDWDKADIVCVDLFRCFDGLINFLSTKAKLSNEVNDKRLTLP
ncbi:GTP-binding protein ERG [Tanacetum coccineum]|uniref:GTP-binding protein ERG n=1 Tax=Tanacetum coccineum TaxID=301880 RepID=A0ABQ5I3D9_9ASTR